MEKEIEQLYPLFVWKPYLKTIGGTTNTLALITIDKVNMCFP